MSSMTPKRAAPLSYAFAVAAVATALSAGAARAQDDSKHLTLIGAQAATVAPHGTVFGSLALTNRRPGGLRDNDGSLALGFGLGSAENSVGLQFTADIASLSRRFGDAGSVGIKLSRRLAAGDWPVYASVAVDRLAPWGSARGLKPAFSATITTFGAISLGGESHPVMLSLGAGNRLRANQTRSGVFAGVGLGLTRNLAASAGWSGEALDVGIGFRLPNLEALNFTLAVNDVTDRRNSRRVTATATWALSDVFGR